MDWRVLIAVFIVGCGIGWQVRAWKDDAHNEKTVIANQTHIINNMKEAGSIGNSTEEKNEKDIADTMSLYPDVVYPANGGVPNVPSSPSQSGSCQSKKHKLTPKQCDVAYDMFGNLWLRDQALSKIK